MPKYAVITMTNLGRKDGRPILFSLKDPAGVQLSLAFQSVEYAEAFRKGAAQYLDGYRMNAIELVEAKDLVKMRKGPTIVLSNVICELFIDDEGRINPSIINESLGADTKRKFVDEG